MRTQLLRSGQAAAKAGLGINGGYLLDPDNNVFGLLSPVMSDGTVAMGGGAEA